jgi:hypothetical protein
MNYPEASSKVSNTINATDAQIDSNYFFIIWESVANN